MERRQLLIIFAMTLSFLFINTYFFSPTPQKTSHEQVVNGKKITVKDLPMTSLSFDSEGKEFACYGVKLGSAVATMTRKESLPKKLFSQGKPLVKLSSTGLDADLVLYGESSDAKILSKTLGQGPSEIVLLSDFENKEQVALSAAQSSGRELILEEELLPHTGAIAITPSAEGWSLVGSWSEEKQSFLALPDLNTLHSAIIQLTEDSKPISHAHETFYVVENDVAQFVFSNLGGALAEVNLKLSPNSSQSGIRPIRFDHLVEEKASGSNLFPNFSYQVANKSGRVVVKSPKKGGYTPVLRRTLKDENNNILSSMAPDHYALNLISEGSAQAPLNYRMISLTKDQVTFEAEENGRKIQKTFTLLPEAPYTLKMSVKVDGDTRGLWVTSGILEVELISNSYTPSLKYLSADAKKGKADKLKLPKTLSNYDQAKALWSANTNGFFGLITSYSGQEPKALQAKLIPGTEVPSRLSRVDPKHNLYPAKDYPGYELLTPYDLTPKTLDFYFFAGPLDNNILTKVDGALMNLSSTIAAGFTGAVSTQGWFFSSLIEPFAKLLFWIMQGLFMATHSWGLSIILLTLVLKLALYPLSAWSFKSNAKMQKLGPKLKEIQEKYKKDPKRLQMETAMLYKNEGVNPFSGCLPLLIQLPFLIGMFNLLKSTFVLRGAGFIPGWINDLTAPDVIFSWTTPIIFFGTSLHLLPIILFALMFLQQKLNAKMQQNKGPMTDQQKQMQHMGTIMSFVMLFIFYNMPSGLNIYFVFSTLFGIVQQYIMAKRMNKQSKKESAEIIEKGN